MFVLKTERKLELNPTSTGGHFKKKRPAFGPTFPWTLKLGSLGALVVLKLFWYWGAAVHGEWGAGVDTIMKKG